MIFVIPFVELRIPLKHRLGVRKMDESGTISVLPVIFDRQFEWFIVVSEILYG